MRSNFVRIRVLAFREGADRVWQGRCRGLGSRLVESHGRASAEDRDIQSLDVWMSGSKKWDQGGE